MTERCRYTAVHLSGYRSSADIFLAPLVRLQSNFDELLCGAARVAEDNWTGADM